MPIMPTIGLDTTTQQHRAMVPGVDFIDPNLLPVASPTVPGIVDLATPAETIAGLNNTKAVTPFDLAAMIATLADLRIVSMAYNAATGLLSLTRSDAVVLSITLTDVEVVTTTAPAVVNDDPIPTDHFGTNANYLGTPTAWLSINGFKVPAY